MAKYDFYHCIELAPGIVTPGWEAPRGSQKLVTEAIAARQFSGKRVLDVGCRDGLFCFDIEKRGARYVLGIDNNISRAAIEFLIPQLKSAVEMREINVYDFETEEKFDVVIFPGVLYHLRFPFLGIKRLADALKPGGEIIVETAMYLAHHDEALLHCPAPKDSPYKEPTSVTFYNHLGLVGALESFDFIDIKCTGLITPSGYKFNSFGAYLAHPCSRQVEIGRAVYTATYSPAETSVRTARDQYWYAKHSAHTNAAVRKDLSRELKGE